MTGTASVSKTRRVVTTRESLVIEANSPYHFAINYGRCQYGAPVARALATFVKNGEAIAHIHGDTFQVGRRQMTAAQLREVAGARGAVAVL